MRKNIITAAVLAVLAPCSFAKTYSLTEVGNLDTAKYSYISGNTNSGETIGAAKYNYNLPIDLTVIDFDDADLKRFYDNTKDAEEDIDKEITFTLEDIENGNINGDAQEFMITFLKSKSSDPEWQKIIDEVAVNYRDGATEQVMFDVNNSDYDGYTRSTNNVLNAITEDGVSAGWGSAPYLKQDFTNTKDEIEVHHVREFTKRAMIIDAIGNQYVIEPEYTTYGGISNATDIVKTAEGYLVVGNQSTGVSVKQQERVDDNCDGKDETVQTCAEAYVLNSSPLYHTRATMWVLDNDLNVTQTVDLGLGLEPKDDEEFAFTSQAMAVNETGTAAGFSYVRWRDGDGIVTNPVYYKDGEVHKFVDQDEFEGGGHAMAINSVINGNFNNQEIITGYVVKRVEGVNKTKFFYHNIDTNESFYPEDFFKGSQSIAHAINQHGIIVGEGEVKSTSSGTPRREGFIFDTGQVGTLVDGKTVNPFTNINDLLPCYDTDGKSAFPYVVAELRTINESNEIMGIATKTVEKRDLLGEVVLNDKGEPEMESTIVAVKLTENPNGVPEECKTPEQEKYQRQGGSISLMGLLLLPLVFLRRRFH